MSDCRVPMATYEPPAEWEKITDQRDRARARFAAMGLSYSDITDGELLMLTMTLNKAFKKARKGAKTPVHSSMTLSKRIKAKHKSNGSIVEAYFFMNAHYFTGRECVSFNKDGFIGFCGWADDKNTAVVIEGFNEWPDLMAEAGKE